MNREMLDSAIAAAFCFIGACVFITLLALFGFLSGCAQTKVDKLMDISLGQKPAQTCPTLVMPPIGTDCLLDIQGDKVTANDCGDTLLRGYVRARSLLKPGASATSSPR